MTPQLKINEMKQSKIVILETFLSMKNKKIAINQYKKVIFGVIIITNLKVTVIEIKHYQLKSILIKLDHT